MDTSYSWSHFENNFSVTENVTVMYHNHDVMIGRKSSKDVGRRELLVFVICHVQLKLVYFLYVTKILPIS